MVLANQNLLPHSLVGLLLDSANPGEIVETGVANATDAAAAAAAVD